MNLQEKLELGAKLNEACIRINETTGYTAWFTGGELFTTCVSGGDDNEEYKHHAYFYEHRMDTHDEMLSELLWHLGEIEEDEQ